MTDENKALLVIMSRILDYPDKLFFQERSAIDECIHECLSSDLQQEVQKGINPLFNLKEQELQELYVDTFDYQEQTNLYLTAHELGDSKKRGAALIKIQNLIYENGLVYNSKQLADYIPMLLEFLAAAGEKTAVLLTKRLAYAIYRIWSHIPCSNPYYNAVELLMKNVFEIPRSEEIAQLEKEREEADLEELPYPLLYR
ncbi:nitrate reductase molybdenum cofactor assembly chaperone [Bacillus benzoevorans]|uniref:Nitrate reductase delta subunit n=1 Tax=Bacillus benzoevorans TaxID=1456 RepID=A0A7X0LW65_9BACI|nr:nitrate reductase molybdenum cofactor assembly chaperone [Bacillus benzoevorans]MBB6446368.1 nitrate reductase delta subunit [Bacillus benzoevorans]